MASGNERNEGAGAGPDPNWWQGAPAPDSAWSNPQQPTQDGPPPGYGVPQPDSGWQPGYQPTAPFPGGPYGAADPTQQFQPSGPNPTQQFSGAPGPDPTMRFTGQQPYQVGPGPYGGAPGYGGQPGYGGGYQQPPGGGKRKIWLFAGIGGLVLAIVIAVVAVALVRNSNDPSAQSNTTPSLVSALTTEKSPGASKPSATPKPSVTKSGTPAPVIPGYQTVTIPEFEAAYDIPKDWTIDKQGTGAFGTGTDQIVAFGLSEEGVDYCTGYTRTTAFVTDSDETDLAKAAADVGARMAKIGYANSTGAKPSTSEKFSTSDGKLSGTFVELTGSAPAPAAGCASTYSIYTFAFSTNQGAYVFTIVADTGVDKAVDKSLAKKILASLRPM
ncbi:hypothetical protein [Nocardia inohanensis]|uniref:hypothetical protein n=1 Tax=Nocardia inohanensis TaxID=209246 RepID=UPI000837166A|nr:hypothetical protein [Nocardia inohanensis]